MNGKAPGIGIDEVYCAAVEYDDPAARAAYLAEACGTDSDLRRQVERLLDARAERGSFLESPALGPTIEYGVGDRPKPQIPNLTLRTERGLAHSTSSRVGRRARGPARRDDRVLRR